MPHLAILDLDGTILGTPDDDRALSALRVFLAGGWHIAIATNQPARVRSDLCAARVIIAEAAGRDVPWYICNHDIGDGCDCRKPQPGLLKCAIDDCGVPAISAWMIGDKWSDMLAAQRIGIHCCLVEWFGYRRAGRTQMQPTKPPDVYCRDLLVAAELLTGVYT